VVGTEGIRKRKKGAPLPHHRRGGKEESTAAAPPERRGRGEFHHLHFLLLWASASPPLAGALSRLLTVPHCPNLPFLVPLSPRPSL
jgi:hypothetical protein